MRYSLVAVAAIAALVSAQDLSGLPACAQSCATTAITDTGCGLDAACICSDESFINSIASCVVEACDSDGQQATVEFAENLCLASSVTLTGVESLLESAAAAFSASDSGSSSASAVSSAVSSAASSAVSSAVSSSTHSAHSSTLSSSVLSSNSSHSTASSSAVPSSSAAASSSSAGASTVAAFGATSLLGFLVSMFL
ncbi:hypothetical protein BZA70DRAFT_282855 [Myxozyma melibiosi]|uniref:CFEM domain-containing protein n=1 Tax=Myxozyma melibiosi TaxID=54550 RepID=A0ABR1F172_9ASCO